MRTIRFFPVALLAKHHKFICLTQQTFYKPRKIVKTEQASNGHNMIYFHLLLREPLQAFIALVFKLQSLVFTLAVSPASDKHMSTGSPLARHQPQVRAEKTPELRFGHRVASSRSWNSRFLGLFAHLPPLLPFAILRALLEPTAHLANVKVQSLQQPRLLPLSMQSIDQQDLNFRHSLCLKFF
jgi:hypothetical protein